MRLEITLHDVKLVIITIGVWAIASAAFIGFVNTLDPSDRGAALSAGAWAFPFAWMIFLTVYAIKMVKRRLRAWTGP